MQSVELSYARYYYFQNNNDVKTKNFRYLFCEEKIFKEQFGISKEELLLLYPYPKEEEIKDVR